MKETQKEKEIIVNEKGMVKGEPGTYLFRGMEVGNSCA